MKDTNLKFEDYPLHVPTEKRTLNKLDSLIKDLEELGLLLEVEPLVHEVGHSERTGVMVEPMIKEQWFVKMEPLAKKVLEFQDNKDNKINFVPKRFEKVFQILFF